MSGAGGDEHARGRRAGGDAAHGAHGEDGPAPRPSASPLEVTVGELTTDRHLGIGLRRLAGESGLARPLRHPRVQKCGLALAGHFYGVVPTRVQVLGETELSYLDVMAPDARSVACRGFFSLGLSCVVVTRGAEPPRALVQAAEATATPLFLSAERSSRTINALHAVLDDRLAPTTNLHGVLVDVFGIGLLLLGKSGIGKSECALELVLRGHRLVADDVVRCDWRPPGMVFGAPADLLRHHIEIRGLGVLNVKDLFGVTAVNERKRIDVIVRLTEWNEKDEYDRLGVEHQNHVILGHAIRMLTVPVRPGRDMGSILEIAARNELLRRAGKDTPKLFLERIEANLAQRQAELAIEPESVAMPVSEVQGRIEAESRVHRTPAPRTAWAQGPSHGVRGAQSPSLATESSAWIPALRATPGEEDDE